MVMVNVIAGEATGQHAVIETRTPIMYLHYKIKPRGSDIQSVPDDYNAFAYVVDGVGWFGSKGKRAGDGQMILFARDGEEVKIENPADSEATLEVLLIAGAYERAHRSSWTVCNEYTMGNSPGF